MQKDDETRRMVDEIFRSRGQHPLSDREVERFRTMSELVKRQGFYLLNKVGARRVLERFNRDYNTGESTITEDSWSFGQAIKYKGIVTDNHELPHPASITIVTNRNSPTADRPTLSITMDKGIGRMDEEISRKTKMISLYQAEGFRDDPIERILPSYRYVRRRIKNEINAFAKQNHLRKTPEAIRRTWRNRIAAVGAFAGGIGTGVKYGQEILQFAQHTLPNLPFFR